MGLVQVLKILFLLFGKLNCNMSVCFSYQLGTWTNTSVRFELLSFDTMFLLHLNQVVKFLIQLFLGGCGRPSKMQDPEF